MALGYWVYAALAVACGAYLLSLYRRRHTTKALNDTADDDFLHDAAEKNHLVPVTVLTGFLGAGKTTLFNHILTAAHGKRIAVIQNEFGEVGIDDSLMAKNAKYMADEEIVETLNGCICCSVRTDLVKAMEKLAARHYSGELQLDAIVIETTGMADPAPVAQTLIAGSNLKTFARLDGVVTVVDAKHIEQHFDEKRGEGVINESVAQVAFADRLLLNKVDLVPDEASLQRIEARLGSINSFAPIIRTTRSQISVDQVLNIHGFDLQRATRRDPTLLDTKRPKTKHDGAIGSHSIDQGAARHLRGVKAGDLDARAVEEWLGELLDLHGADVYRVKGVLAIAHSKLKYVFHAVHMTMDGDFEGPWMEGEARESKLVFIGKNLDPKALNAGFNSCLDTPELRAERLKELRFKVGDVVECNPGNGRWQEGEIVNLMVPVGEDSPGLVAPYEVRLTGMVSTVFVPEDDDDVVRTTGRRWERSVVQAATTAHSHDHSYGGGHDQHGHVHDEHCNHDGTEDADKELAWDDFEHTHPAEQNMSRYFARLRTQQAKDHHE